MNEKSINQHLAMVMGWKTYFCKGGTVEYCEPDPATHGMVGVVVFTEAEWDPYNIFDQAWLCAQKMQMAGVRRSTDIDGGCEAFARKHEDITLAFTKGVYETPASALSIVIAKETGWVSVE